LLAEKFPVEHAHRHQLKDDGRESLAHMILLPEEGIAGWVYPTMRSTGNSRGRAYLFGPGIGEPIIEEAEEPLDPDMDFDDWRSGPLRMAVREPHETVELAWKGERIDLDGRFTALHPPYAFSLHPGGNPPYYGDDRTEQHGRFVADLRIDGREIHHDGFMIRDHSWGPRVWGLNQHYKWFHAVTPEISVHMFEMQSFGSVHVRGYVFKDGVMGNIMSTDYDITYDDAMFQQALRVTVNDSEGRTVTVNSETFATIQNAWDPEVYLNEAALKVDIEGNTGTGWVEFCWNRKYYDFAKDYVTRFGKF
jgi:hypothetical protein